MAAMISSSPISNERWAYASDQYEKLFKFLFIYRVIAIIYAFVWILFKAKYQIYLLNDLIVVFALAGYTTLAFFNRRKVFELLTDKPAFAGVDVLIGVGALLVSNSLNTPFYLYSLAPVIFVSIMYRFRGAFTSSVLMAIAQVISAFIHGISLGELLSVEHFPLLFGQIVSYFIIGYLCIYPADMVLEITRQRHLIKLQAEREATFEERARLARELHDNLTQLVTIMKAQATSLSENLKGDNKVKADEITGLTTVTLLDLRNAIFALRSENLDQDLGEMLECYCRRFSASTGCRVFVHCVVEDVGVSTEEKYEILRICQEALGNISHHANTTMARLTVEKDEGTLVIRIEDSGKGFDGNAIEVGVGLMSMRERAERLGANLEISSALDEGTRIVLKLAPKTKRLETT